MERVRRGRQRLHTLSKLYSRLSAFCERPPWERQQAGEAFGPPERRRRLGVSKQVLSLSH